jgi:hypothetical protein
MRAVHLVRPGVAATVMAASACTIWAAIDDPYKSEQAATVDAGSEAAASHQIDAGGVPYAIAAYGDSVYVVDDLANVHVAVEAGTTFTAFFAVGDAGDVFNQSNRVAASSAGVFWTVNKGIRYCALDGGDCGVLARKGTPTLIAAAGSVVAWKEPGDGGIGRCDGPLSQCTPVSTPTEPASSIAVEPDGTVAYASNRAAIGFFGGPGPRRVLPVNGRQVDYVAADPGSGALYWIGPTAVGAVPFDSGTANLPTPIDNGTPSQLFAFDGLVYWSVPSLQATAIEIDVCRFVDGGCIAGSSPVGTVIGGRADQGIAASPRDVFTIVARSSGNPELLVWPTP